MCLLVFVGLIGWQVQRTLYPSEAALYARAKSLMEQEDTSKWIDAKDIYLPSLLTRFPEGEFAEEAQELLDKAEMYFAEQQARNLGPRKPRTEGQRLYIEADKFERFGDRITALEIYESMIDLLADRPEDRIYVLLATRQRNKITEEGGDKLDRVQIIEEVLARAEEQAAAGKLLEARKSWNSIVTLYADNQELAPFVDRARDLLEETRRGRRATEETQPAQPQ